MNAPVLQASPVLPVSKVHDLVECMRPAQWIKNGFVLSALLFSANLSDPRMGLRALVAFAAFCLAASGIYLWNDSIDWRSDLSHPEKRRRPIPSGRLNVGLTMTVGSVLLLCGVFAAFRLNAVCGVLLLIYVAMNFVYSLWLKHAVILDLISIALGFVLRVMMGAAAIGVEASHWLLMCTFLLALFLGIAKRRQELVMLASDSARHRRVLVNYSLPWLDQAGTMLSGATLVAYALYTVAPETQQRFGTDHLIYTLPFVVYGILRYLHLIHAGDRTGNPTGALIADKQLLGCVAGWILACSAIIYF